MVFEYPFGTALGEQSRLADRPEVPGTGRPGYLVINRRVTHRTLESGYLAESRHFGQMVSYVLVKTGCLTKFDS
jgi:hypothetical protein